MVLRSTAVMWRCSLAIVLLPLFVHIKYEALLLQRFSAQKKEQQHIYFHLTGKHVKLVCGSVVFADLWLLRSNRKISKCKLTLFRVQIFHIKLKQTTV